MRDYLLYPQALEKIEKSGIKARVEELAKKEELPYIGGFVSEMQIMRTIEDLTKAGYYTRLPSEFADLYKSTMAGILHNPEHFFWNVERPTGKMTEPCQLEDLLLFSGDLASMILKREEIWDYSKFGFASASELVATVGAYLKKQSDLDFKKGYSWTRKHADGSEIVTEITGDSNADLRIYQTDIASYPTKDPFGNTVELRPEMKADKHAVAAYHSTEAILLVAVMKYIGQQNIPVEYRSDDATKLIEWGRSLGQGGGSCAEHFGGFESNIGLFFIGDDTPIPTLDESNQTTEYSNFSLPTESGGLYGTYIAHNGDLVLSYGQREKEKQKSVKEISVRFSPEDAEHLVKGLIYQSARGLGRTSAKSLLDIVISQFPSALKIQG